MIRLNPTLGHAERRVSDGAAVQVRWGGQRWRLSSPIQFKTNSKKFKFFWTFLYYARKKELVLEKILLSIRPPSNLQQSSYPRLTVVCPSLGLRPENGPCREFRRSRGAHNVVYQRKRRRVYSVGGVRRAEQFCLQKSRAPPYRLYYIIYVYNV